MQRRYQPTARDKQLAQRIYQVSRNGRDLPPIDDVMVEAVLKSVPLTSQGKNEWDRIASKYRR